MLHVRSTFERDTLIINLAIEAKRDLCAWLVAELARRRDNLVAMGSDATEYSFDDCIVGLLWDA